MCCVQSSSSNRTLKSCGVRGLPGPCFAGCTWILGQMCCSLNSFKGGYIGGYIGDYIGVIKGDTRSLDYRPDGYLNPRAPCLSIIPTLEPNVYK